MREAGRAEEGFTKRTWRLGLRPRERGFTLIEALVALAVVAAGLAAIGQLGFSALAVARRVEARLFLTNTARKLFAALPAAPGEGGADGASWRLQTSPFPFDAPGSPLASAWRPEAVRLIVTGRSGARIVVDTVRLRPTGAAR